MKKVNDKKNETRFDLVLRKEYLPDENVFHQVSGVYKMDNGAMMEFYRDGDLLFTKQTTRYGAAWPMPETIRLVARITIRKQGLNYSRKVPQRSGSGSQEGKRQYLQELRY